ncbi:MAG: type III-B CRISPR module RAMP protein Cmr4 [Fretibacterium sp.]|nr:type III-B CRISPR module RAMP protein Cmr4 [Fretibacterium sp.]
MKNKFYMVKCVTNLHMGSGDINFSIIDNEVQRDPVTGHPSMYSSGIKGAMREHFEANPETKGLVTSIFGSAIGETSGDKKKSSPGRVKFLSANLLLQPVRSALGALPYYLVTTKAILQAFVTELTTIRGETEDDKKLAAAIQGLDEQKAYSMNTNGAIHIEGGKYPTRVAVPADIATALQTYHAVSADDLSKLLILPDADFRSEKIHLPVLARNQLDNGESKNLWYEEVVPHDAVFYFAVLSDGTEPGDKALEDFAGVAEKDRRLFQFGGNATIGYGLTQLTAF